MPLHAVLNLTIFFFFFFFFFKLFRFLLPPPKAFTSIITPRWRAPKACRRSCPRHRRHLTRVKVLCPMEVLEVVVVVVEETAEKVMEVTMATTVVRALTRAPVATIGRTGH